MHNVPIPFSQFNSLSDADCQERIRAARAKLGKKPSSSVTTTSVPMSINTRT